MSFEKANTRLAGAMIESDEFMEESDLDKILAEIQELKTLVVESTSEEKVVPRLLTVQEAAKYLGIGKTEAYARLRQHVRCIKHGKKILVPKEELDHLIEKAKRTGKLFE